MSKERENNPHLNPFTGGVVEKLVFSSGGRGTCGSLNRNPQEGAVHYSEGTGHCGPFEGGGGNRTREKVQKRRNTDDRIPKVGENPDPKREMMRMNRLSLKKEPRQCGKSE